MKKTLYSTTFLATAGVLALGSGDAYAQAAAPAAEKLKISIGGYMQQVVGYSDQGGSWEDNNLVTSRRKHFDVKSDGEIYFSGSVKLDNGMTVSVMTQLETQRSTSTGGAVVAGATTTNTADYIDESYMTINTGYGEVKLGQTDAVGATLAAGAPVVGYIPTNTDQELWIVQPAGAIGHVGAGTSFSAGNDDNRVSYLTPSIMGFRAGVTYTPSASAQSEAQPGVAETDMTNLAIQYSGKFDAVAFRVSSDWYRNNAATSTASSDNWGVAADVTFADITLGGGYTETENNGEGTLAAATTALDYERWNVGIRYNPGPWAVGLFYSRTTAPATSADPDDTTNSRLSLGATYTMGPGVTLLGSIFRHTYEVETDTAASENKAWAAVGGIKVDF